MQYAGASGDYNPLHTDEIYTTKIAGYPSVFAHGMLTMGLTGQAIAGLVGAGNLLRFGVRFTAQVWPGDTLTVRSSVVRIEEDDGGPVAEFSVSTVANRRPRMARAGKSCPDTLTPGSPADVDFAFSPGAGGTAAHGAPVPGQDVAGKRSAPADGHRARLRRRCLAPDGR